MSDEKLQILQQSVDEIKDVVGYLKDNMVLKSDFEKHVGAFDKHVGAFDKHVIAFDKHVNAFDNHVSSFDKHEREFLEFVDFVKENVVTYDELDIRIAALKDDITNNIDDFTVMYKRIDIEMVAMRAKYERLEGYIHQLASHAKVELT